jgi:heptaprenyl diphosphate synthase
MVNSLECDRVAQDQILVPDMVNTYPETDSPSSNGFQHHAPPMRHLILPDSLLADLEHVDRTMLERVQSNSALINIAGKHVLRSRGKRLRASLALLAAQLGNDYHLETVLHSAAAVELIHVASLVHDDLVDEAERRRGVVSVHTQWDHGVALMVGDYFFALASKEMSLAPDSRIITFFSEAVMTICEGELAPVMSATPLEIALEQYYYKIGCKTASLFAAACQAGMASGGGTQEHIDALGAFGYDLGLAFQVIDDILDFTGDEALLGKPAGSDLRQGVITLPLIYAVEVGDDGERLAASVDSDDEYEISWAIEEVQQLGVVKAHEEAQAIINRALRHLSAFSDSPALQTLHDIATFVLERDK